MYMQTGADPAFPWLLEDQRFSFPSVDTANEQGVLAAGGNLSPGMLLSAYSQGIFPWFCDGDPVLWWSLNPRFVLIPSELHISATMRKLIKKESFVISVDTAFGDVIRLCACVPRKGQLGTWITSDMIQAYEELHRLGYAHSVEARSSGSLVGGLYGVSLGSVFFGESMFSLKSDASKAAFIPFVLALRDMGFTLIDSQMETAHVASMGGKSITRSEYIAMLTDALRAPTMRGTWTSLFALSGADTMRRLV